MPENTSTFIAKHCTVREQPHSPMDVYILHGFGSYRGAMTEFSWWFRKKGYTTIMCDARGHGLRFLTSLPFDWSGTVDDYNALIRDRGRPVVVMGDSMGGSLALTLGATNPLVKRVFAISALHDIDPKDYVPSVFAQLSRKLMHQQTIEALPKHFLRCDEANREKFFLIHADNDYAAPFRHFERNRDQLCLPSENTLVISGMPILKSHGNIGKLPSARAFIKSHLGQLP